MKAGGIKLRRCARYKARYTARVNITARNKARRANKRELHVAFFTEFPETGSPSQIKMRRKVGRRKAKKAAVNQQRNNYEHR
jgi:hypothetical protein